ncbi:MAG: MT-A70 family methyltransferase [Pirellulales bacterium]
MAYVLTADKKLSVVHLLVKGNSIRSTVRLTGVHRDTIMRVLMRVGNQCRELLDERMRNKEPVMTLPGLKGRFSTILCDPPWRFQNRTGKMAPEHRRLRRYQTMSLEEIRALPVSGHAAEQSHLYLWCPNCPLRRGPIRDAGLGVHLQEQHRLVQGPQGWRA